jgi:hypothetical protein
MEKSLALLWENFMATLNQSAANRALQILAAVPESSVPYLKSRLKDRLPLSDEEGIELRRLAEDLDTNEVRSQEVLREISAYGPKAHNELRAIIASTTSPEILLRLRTLIEEAQAQSPEQKERRTTQVGLTFQILQKCGTEEARELLRLISEKGIDATDRRAAGRSLSAFQPRPIP